jgi:O-antigen/teichoic acid export membrane protein
MSVGWRLVRNILYTLGSKLVLLAVAVVTVPIVVRGLGPEVFGLYALASVVIGYLAFLDMGTGQALVKYLSEALARDDRARATRLIETAATVFLGMGLVGGLLVAGSADLLVRRVLHLPPDLLATGRTVFRVAAVGFVFTMALNGLCAVFQAHQRLDAVARVNTFIGATGLVVPVVLLRAGLGLPAIILGNVIVNATGVAVLVGLLRTLPAAPRLRLGLHGAEARALLHFGGATLVGTLAAQVSLQVDKLIIGAVLPLARVAYYAVPFNLAAKLFVVPYAVGPALFPAVSQTAALGRAGELRMLYLRTTKVLFTTSLPLVLILAVWADRVLAVWIGEDFALEGTRPLRILAAAFFVLLMTQPATDVARGTGRPGIGAAIGAADAALVTVLCLLLVPRLGIDGAALAILVGTGAGSLLFIALVQRTMLGLRHRDVIAAALARPLLAGLACAVLLWALRPAVTGLLALGLLALAVLALYAAATYSFVLDGRERAVLATASGRLLRRPA